MPVMKRTKTTPRPIMPIVTSLILSSSDLHDVTDENQALDKAADRESVGHRIERDVSGERDFARRLEFIPKFEQVPADEDEEHQADEPGRDIESILDRLG